MLKIMQANLFITLKIFVQAGRMKTNNVNNANKTTKGAEICLKTQRKCFLELAQNTHTAVDILYGQLITVSGKTQEP